MKRQKVESVSDDPAVIEARRLLYELHAEKKEAEDSITRLSGKIADDPGQKDAVTAAAEARLAGGELVALASVESLRGDLAAAYARRRVAGRALQMQQRRVDEVEAVAAFRILATQDERHRELATKILEAARALAAVSDEYRNWRNEVEAAGCTPSSRFEPAPSSIIGWRLEGQQFGRMEMVLDWARNVGALSDAEFRAATQKAA